MAKTQKDNKTMVTFNNVSYEYDTLSSDCKSTLSKLTKIEQEYPVFHGISTDELEKMETYKAFLLEKIKNQLPQKVSKEKESDV